MTYIKSIVKSFNKPFAEIKSLYTEDFEYLLKEEEVWLGDLDNKTNLITDQKDRLLIDTVINKLKDVGYEFVESDTIALSKFTSKINEIVKVADRLNNFKENTLLANGEKLRLFVLFNTIKRTNSIGDLKINLNSNLNPFIPHLFSVIKHAQNPKEYPIYYKYWKNITREVFSIKHLVTMKKSFLYFYICQKPIYFLDFSLKRKVIRMIGGIVSIH